MDQSQNSTSNFGNSTSAASMQNSIIDTLIKFESAISGLTQTVEQTRHNIEHIVDLSMKSKDELKHIKDTLMPYVSTAADASQKVVTKVRNNPRPFAFAMVGLFGTLFLLSFLGNRHKNVADAAIH